jgi:two-component system response regulator PhcR
MKTLSNTHDFSAISILYVDDEEMAQKYFLRSVESEFDVLTASGADEAEEMLRDKALRIGILVTDYRMPGRDGCDLLCQIEREFPHIIRIMVTAYADRDTLLHTVNSGEVFRILEKPLNITEVKNTLRQAYALYWERTTRQQRLIAMNETLNFLAHELNTPLASIANFSQGMQRRIGDENWPCQPMAEIAKAALAINDNAQYCLSLLLSFVNSIHSINPSINCHSEMTAHQMVLSLLDSYPLTPEQHAAIKVDIQKDFKVTALPNCVALVLSSILSNALRALKGHLLPQVTFSILVDDTPQICISNNGPCIPPDILSRLMETPFTTHADSGGKGWGMVFCRRVMHSFGGDIVISSTPESNTIVTLKFPPTKARLKSSGTS